MDSMENLINEIGSFTLYGKSISDFFNACKNGNYSIVENYLLGGLNPSVQDINRSTALHYSVRFPEIVRLLIRYRANLNVEDEFGRTPLVLALTCNMESFEILLRSGADPNIETDYSHTPLCLALYFNNSSAIRLLIQHGANPHSVGFDGINALRQAQLDRDDEYFDSIVPVSNL
jgi:ankyrin repeat protein